MINKETLIEYVNIMNKYNSFEITITEQEKNIINLINSEIENNEEFRKFIESLDSSFDKMAIIDEYFKESELEKSKSENEVIAQTFGIDISKIEHKYLNNGKEVFCFYDMKFGRPIVLENNKNGVSLVEQLKEIQFQNKDYQTSNDEKNVQNMLEDKTFKENCELSMIPIEEVGEHLNQVKELSLEEYKMLYFLIKNSVFLDIKYVNIENLIAFDADGKLYEVYKNSLLEYKIGEPDSASYYKEENINVSDRINDDYTISEQNVALQSNYEDQPNILEESPVEEENGFDYLPEELQEKVIMFYEYPNLLNDLSDEEREMWKEYISMYQKKLEQEENKINKENNAPKIRRYVKEDNNKGYISYSIIMLSISVIITIVTFVIVFNNR